MKIENYKDLKAEISRLEEKKKIQEELLVEKLHTLKSNLTPQNIFLNSLSSISGIPLNKAEFLKKGMLVALTFVIQRLLRKSEIKIETAISEFMAEAGRKIKDFFKRNREEKENENDSFSGVNEE
jgi:hypothetical protein